MSLFNETNFESIDPTKCDNEWCDCKTIQGKVLIPVKNDDFSDLDAIEDALAEFDYNSEFEKDEDEDYLGDIIAQYTFGNDYYEGGEY